MTELPQAIRDYLDGPSAAGFTPDAVVTDDGRTYRGTEEIDGWLHRAATEYQYTATLTGVSRAAGELDGDTAPDRELSRWGGGAALPVPAARGADRRADHRPLSFEVARGSQARRPVCAAGPWACRGAAALAVGLRRRLAAAFNAGGRPGR